MKKIACAVLILIMVLILVNPPVGEARGGHGGRHWGWWAPLAIIGGAAVLAPLYGRYYESRYPRYYYAPYDVSPPVVIQGQVPASGQAMPPAEAAAERIFIYPRQGQTEAQQADDRYECHRWSVGQTGFDPTQPSERMSETQLNQRHSDYRRALSACLDGRGYTMR